MTGLLVEDRGPVRILTLNRPERRNALDLPDREVFLEALRSAESEARAIVLAGAGETFCAGGDITSMNDDPEIGRRRLELVNAISKLLITGPVPVVTAVEGGAYGLGLGLACAGDLTVTGRSGAFVASFAKIGLAPDTGLSWTLPRRVGAALSRRMLLTAIRLDAEQALAAGLVDEVVDDGAARERAVEIADDLARLSAPMVQAMRRILSQPDQTLDGVLAAEGQAQVELFASAEFAEGRAAFLERRKPDFVAAGRHPVG